MKKSRPRSEYDELPEHKDNHTLHILALLMVLAGALFYWWHQPRPAVIHSQELSLHGIHLGQDYNSLVKQLGAPGHVIQSPQGERSLNYSNGESYYLKADRVAYMDTNADAGAVQFAQGVVKVGDSRDSIEKLLGVVEPERVSDLTTITWPGPDCRFTVKFDRGWTARSLRIYAP